MVNVIRPGVLGFEANVCAGCGICEVMCSLFHEGAVRPALARSHMIREPFTAKHRHFVCRQCSSPACYAACPLKDKAICIDDLTGITYINEAECTGCGMCVEACPFDPPGMKINTDKQVVFKCDLCMNRKAGPTCVEYCPFQALKFNAKDKRD
jgi:Fe-S-cluster-containing hydrogenase component 2